MDAGDVDVMERQRVGELIQEPDRIRRSDMEYRVLLRAGVVDLDLDWYGVASLSVGGLMVEATRRANSRVSWPWASGLGQHPSA